MLATPNSWGAKPAEAQKFQYKAPFFSFAASLHPAIWVAFLVTAAGAMAGNQDSPAIAPRNTDFAKRAEKAYADSKTRLEAATNDPAAEWQFGRACYDWADFATNASTKADIAQKGIAACRNLVGKNPDSAPGHYYLAMNLGQLADARKGLEALHIVGQIEAEFKLALGLDPQLDFAGPDRNLGLLYLQAPGWPISIGSKSRARQHLQKALKLFPQYPENHLNLIEAELASGDDNGALRQVKSMNEIWPEARKKLTGDEWAAEWANWEKRRDDLSKKTELSKSPVGSRKM